MEKEYKFRTSLNSAPTLILLDDWSVELTPSEYKFTIYLHPLILFVFNRSASMDEELLYYGASVAFGVLWSVVLDFIFIYFYTGIADKRIKSIWASFKGLQILLLLTVIALIAQYYQKNFVFFVTPLP